MYKNVYSIIYKINNIQKKSTKYLIYKKENVVQN